MVVFLDLEETLIDDWREKNFLHFNRDKIVDAILSANKDMTDQDEIVLGLMSWAVWDQNDRDTFNSELREPIEEALGFRFDDRFILSMMEWASWIRDTKRKIVSMEDLFDIFNKEEVLFMVSRAHPLIAGRNIVLIDDVVDHGLEWTHRPTNTSVRVLNVKEL